MQIILESLYYKFKLKLFCWLIFDKRKQFLFYCVLAIICLEFSSKTYIIMIYTFWAFQKYIICEKQTKNEGDMIFWSLTVFYYFSEKNCFCFLRFGNWLLKILIWELYNPDLLILKFLKIYYIWKTDYEFSLERHFFWLLRLLDSFRAPRWLLVKNDFKNGIIFSHNNIVKKFWQSHWVRNVKIGRAA